MTLMKRKVDTVSIADDVPERDQSPVKSSQRSGARRTHRACDRCRVKKSKCNGQQPCSTCSANDRTCVFSALRRRDIRKWHCHMQDTVDEAIQRLYRACREHGCFPGDLPLEQDGYVTTEAILHAMGFHSLDIGPRKATEPDAPLQQQLPIRGRPGQPPSGRRSPQLSDVQSEDMNYSKDSGDSYSRYSPTSSATLNEFNFPPPVHSPYQQRSPVMALDMSDQFHEAINGRQPYMLGHTSGQRQAGPQQYHHHPMPGQNQFNPSEQSTHVAPHYVPIIPTDGRVQQYPVNPTLQYAYPQYALDHGLFVNPHQIWPGYDVIEVASR